MEDPQGWIRQTLEEKEDAGNVYRGGGHASVQAGETDRVPVAARVIPGRGRQRG